jgi:predicted transcriptional regulator
LKNRNRTDIVVEILRAANSGATAKVKLMYRSYLSYTQLNEYLIVLVRNGLIDYDARTNLYRTTEKGARFLNLYEKFREVLEKEYNNNNNNNNSTTTA